MNKLSILIILTLFSLTYSSQFLPQVEVPDYTINPGIRFELASHTVNRLLSKYIIPEINYDLQNLHFPDFYNHEDHIKLWLTNIRLSSIYIDPKNTGFTLQDQQIIFNLRIVNPTIRFHYKARCHVVRYSHDGYGQADWINFRLAIKLGNLNGKLQLNVVNVQTTKGHIKVSIGGGHIKAPVNRMITRNVNRKFDSWDAKIRDVVVAAVEKNNNYMKTTHTFNGIKTVFDYSLISDPIVTNTRVILNQNGNFYPVGTKATYLDPPYTMQPIRNLNSKVYISDDSLFHLIYCIWKEKQGDNQITENIDIENMIRSYSIEDLTEIVRNELYIYLFPEFMQNEVQANGVFTIHHKTNYFIIIYDF